MRPPDDDVFQRRWQLSDLGESISQLLNLLVADKRCLSDVDGAFEQVKHDAFHLPIIAFLDSSAVPLCSLLALDALDGFEKVLYGPDRVAILVSH
ncbi:unnamed protein product [Clonostachys byssicola]|uniref:Uncharacterized protein n=1 Tax=Clonostachys byssicola TaxID=160290 RepID=A0A9N9XWQ3_9HYPO|nr:unnamed protein product [Clonostachys byssicola]